MGKVKTPDWILEGFDSLEAYNKAKGKKAEKKSSKTFKIKKCPACASTNVGVVLGEVGMWRCNDCGFKGTEIIEEEVSEEEFLNYLDKQEKK